MMQILRITYSGSAPAASARATRPTPTAHKGLTFLLTFAKIRSSSSGRSCD